MSGLHCVRAARLLDAGTGALSDADRLRLEEHLEGCDQCRRDASLLARLRALSDTAAEPLPVAARERALARALAEAGRAPAATRAAGRARPLLLGGAALAAAALALLALWPGGGTGPDAATAPRAEAPTAPEGGHQRAVDHLVAGQLEVDGSPLPAGAALRAGATLRTQTGAELALAHGRVRLTPGSEVRWNGEARTLVLARGRVAAEVDPSAHARFAVRTERFEVVVLGTRFEVSEEEVVVQRGRVRVTDPEGRTLVPALGPGERWHVDEVAAAAAGEAEGEAPQAAVASATPEAAERQTPRPRAPKPIRDPKVELAAIRALLAGGDTGHARTRLAALMKGRLASSQRAEALSLRAECGQVEGDLGSAVADYLQVARRYRGRAAGENALFAAARLERQRGRKAASQKLFERYLERYPEGRFERDAEAGLRELAR